MLKSSLFPESNPQGLAPYFVSSPQAIMAMMIELRDEAVAVTAYIENGFIPAEAQIRAVLPDANVLIFVAATPVEHELLLDANAITAVAFRHGVKLQFDTLAAGTVATRSGIGAVAVSLPTEVLRLQRRAHERVKPSRIGPLDCIIRGPANRPSLHRLPVLDISTGGVALLEYARRDAIGVGRRLINCVFDLAQDGEIVTDLFVRNVDRADGCGGWRYGCEFARIPEEALMRLGNYIERIGEQRRSALALAA